MESASLASQDDIYSFAESILLAERGGRGEHPVLAGRTSKHGPTGRRSGRGDLCLTELRARLSPQLNPSQLRPPITLLL